MTKGDYLSTQVFATDYPVPAIIFFSAASEFCLVATKDSKNMTTFDMRRCNERSLRQTWTFISDTVAFLPLHRAVASYDHERQIMLSCEYSLKKSGRMQA